jgi:hypothetical protein
MKGKHLRSIREDHGTLDFQHEVPPRHPVYLRVADVCHGGGRRPQDAAPRLSARASHSCSLIYIGQYLLRFGSFCRVIHSYCQAHLGYSDRDVHPSAVHRSTEHLHQHRPPAKIHLMITPRSGPTPMGTPQWITASSLWWPQMGIGPATAPVGIPLLEDQNLMPKPLALG